MQDKQKPQVGVKYRVQENTKINPARGMDVCIVYCSGISDTRTKKVKNTQWIKKT